MKSLLLAVALIATASFLSSCQQDPTSSRGGVVLPLSSNTPAANPAVTYIGTSTETVKKTIYTYDNISVMDSTAANQTNIVTAANNNTEEGFGSPSWNYSGTSIAYSDFQVTSVGIPYSIKAVDVSVNSKGVPVGSNGRTIYTIPISDSISILSGPAWCSTSSTGMIAFTRNDGHYNERGKSELCIISQAGGTPTILDSIQYYYLSSSYNRIGRFTYPTWSPDDSKIAVVRADTDYVSGGTTGYHQTILIVNSSTGAIEDSIPLSMIVYSMEWSRSGADELVFTAHPAGGTTEIYYCAPTTGSTPSTNSVVCTAAGRATWSPNNSGIMYINSSSALSKLQSYTSNSTSLQSGNPGGGLNWKR